MGGWVGGGESRFMDCLQQKRNDAKTRKKFVISLNQSCFLADIKHIQILKETLFCEFQMGLLNLRKEWMCTFRAPLNYQNVKLTVSGISLYRGLSTTFVVSIMKNIFL